MPASNDNKDPKQALAAQMLLLTQDFQRITQIMTKRLDELQTAVENLFGIRPD